MVKFGSLKNVEVKKIKLKEGVWVSLFFVGFFGTLFVVDGIARGWM